MNCNVIINNWQESLEKYFHYVKDNIGSKLFFHNLDRNCLSLGLQHTDYLIKYQKCHHCDMVTRFLNNEILTAEDEIDINYGKYKGDKINFHRYNYQAYYIFPNDNKINKNIVTNINKFILDASVTDNIYYYGFKNAYLNQALINVVLYTIGKNKNFPNTVNFLNFFTCRDKIILLDLNYEINNFKELLGNPLFASKNIIKNNIVQDIWIQLIIYFLFYENFYFTHNEANINFLKINSELNNFIFEEKEYISAFKLYILPSKFSAISIYNSDNNKWARLYHTKSEMRNFNNLVSSWYIGWDGIEKKERKLCLDSMEEFEKGKIIYYYLGEQADKFLYFRRHHGSMIMYKSFDLLCFMISLMIEKYIYESVKNNKKLNKVWQELWLTEEIDNLEADIKECKKNTFINVFQIIRKYHLRSDALEYMKNKLLN